MKTEMKTGNTPIDAILWCPSKEGHLRYTHHLAEAIAKHGEARGPVVAVLTTCPIEALYEDTPYPMPCVGQRIRERDTFATPLHWAFDRIRYRLTLERLMLAWVRAHPTVRTVHLQEAHLLTAPLTALRLKRLGKRVVYTMHNIAPHVKRGASARRLHHALTRAFLQRTDALIVHADALRDALAADYRIDPARIHVVPHGVWAADANGSIGSNGSNGNHPGANLLFYGTIRENKGLHHLLDALAGAPAHWRLTVAGKIDEPAYFDTQLAPRIKALVAAGRSLDMRLGYVPEQDVPALFRAADLLVLPYDGFLAQSGVLFDAITWKTPVVVTPTGALGDTVRASGIGIVSRSAAPEDLRDALTRGLALDRTALADAWTRVRDQHSWSRAAALTLDVYGAPDR